MEPGGVFASMFRLALVAPVLFAACSSAGGTDGADPIEPLDAPPLVAPLLVPNQGGDLEGHTPLGFAGSGTGLFVGDNLNERFPDGEGIQLLLTFELPPESAGSERALLTSDALTVRGTPFDDLGDLLVEPVTYDDFGPPLFELEPDGDAVVCERQGAGSVICDVTSVAAGTHGRVQFRLRFERRGDNDGTKDLALFFLTDSNTNEPGIFTLELS